MLVLKRFPRPGRDEIVIDGTIRVFVNEVHGDAVKIAIDAPRSVLVLRGEHLKSNEPTKTAGSSRQDAAAPADSLR